MLQGQEWAGDEEEWVGGTLWWRGRMKGRWEREGMVSEGSEEGREM